MPYIVGDILRFTTLTRLFGEECLNVYHMVIKQLIDPIVQAPVDYARAFHETIASQMCVVSTPITQLTSTFVENISAPLEPFGEYLFLVGGSRVGEAMPSFTAIAYQQKVSTKKTKSGAKRYVGLSESDYNQIDYTPAFQALLLTASTFLWGEHTLAFGNILQPELVAVMEHIVLKSDYTLPMSPSQWQPVTSAVYKTQPTTQNTRKRR